MLTARKLEMMNGHAVAVKRSGEHVYAVCICNCGDTLSTISEMAYVELLVLERLRDKVLAEHGRIAMDKAGWKCENCMGVTGLSAHHKIFRSHTRDDRVANLKACCTRCHQQEHKC